jgi:hypothetical protein
MTRQCPLENCGLDIGYVCFGCIVQIICHGDLLDRRLCLYPNSAPVFWHIEQHLCLQQYSGMRCEIAPIAKHDRKAGFWCFL